MNNHNISNQQFPEHLPAPSSIASTRLMPLWSVILYNDQHNVTHFVVAALAIAINISDDKATKIMLEAHTHGRSVVITEPLERAELHYDRLYSFGLVVGLEEAE